MKRSTIVEIISALFILLFVYTASSKLLGYDNFKGTIIKSAFLRPYVDIVAWLVPAVELIVSISLFLPRTRLWGLFGSLGLMIAFTAYVGLLLVFEKNLPCSCGGVISNMTWTQHLIFNSLFTILAAIGIWLKQKPSQQNTVTQVQAVFT
jgi:hypothetical protein